MTTNFYVFHFHKQQLRLERYLVVEIVKQFSCATENLLSIHSYSVTAQAHIHGHARTYTVT